MQWREMTRRKHRNGMKIKASSQRREARKENPKQAKNLCGTWHRAFRPNLIPAIALHHDSVCA
jgi:hypothetical protein